MKTNITSVSKNFKTLFVLFIFTFFTGLSAFSQAAARTYIRSKLRFFYVANPNADAARSIVTINSNETDERNVFAGNAAMNPMKVFLKALLNDPAHGGDEIFQTAFKEILKIRDKLIDVNMYNDAVPFNNHAQTTFVNCVDNANYEWPCASNAPSLGASGTIHIGQHFFTSQSSINAKFVILHELTHTQDMSQFSIHPFYVNGKLYRYGLDDQHQYHEVVPSMAYAFMEGIANAFAYQFAGGQSYGPALNGWFTPNREIIVEMATPPPTVGAHPDIWLYTQLTAAGVTPIGTSGGYAQYRLSQLPARILIHNEMIIANIIYEYINHISFVRVARALREYNLGATSVFSGNGNLQTMMTVLCQAGLPESMRAQSFPSCADFPDRKEYLLPLAYADYFTGFSSTSLDAFNKLFDNGMNEQLIQCYWNNRPAVKTAATATGVTGFSRAATEIAIALGINSSRPED